MNKIIKIIEIRNEIDASIIENILSTNNVNYHIRVLNEGDPYITNNRIYGFIEAFKKDKKRILTLLDKFQNTEIQSYENTEHLNTKAIKKNAKQVIIVTFLVYLLLSGIKIIIFLFYDLNYVLTVTHFIFTFLIFIFLYFKSIFSLILLFVNFITSFFICIILSLIFLSSIFSNHDNSERYLEFFSIGFFYLLFSLFYIFVLNYFSKNTKFNMYFKKDV